MANNAIEHYISVNGGAFEPCEIVEILEKYVPRYDVVEFGNRVRIISTNEIVEIWGDTSGYGIISAKLYNQIMELKRSGRKPEPRYRGPKW